MKKILLECDSIVIDGIEITYNELKDYLTERIVLKRQLEVVETIFRDGGVNE